VGERASVDGVLLIDKPAGKTSHDVVATVRRELGGDRSRPRPKVGHAGTLDPFATGLLLVLVGRATRAQRFFMDLPKTYETVARFGAVSTTGDVDGEITETGAPIPDPLVLPTGTITQRPPAYSAIKVGGQRAYKLARAGEAVEIPERTVTVRRFDELRRAGDRVAFEIECSSGTYVRSLIADLGDAYCEELRRTAIGPFSVDDADPATPVPLADALGRVLPVVRVEDPEQARRASHGLAVTGDASGPALLVDADGPIAIAEPRDGTSLKPIVGFRSA
jgi:tRNA pseudouridine55 synthase